MVVFLRSSVWVLLGRLLLALVLLTSLPAGAERQPDAEIADLQVIQDGPEVKVSFHLIEAFQEPTLDRIQSGLPTGFTYQVRLDQKKRWWWNSNVEASTIQVMAMYNAITREYLVNYKQDGRLVDSRVVTELEDLEDAMTIFNEWRVFSTELRKNGNSNGRLILRVRAEVGAKHLLAFIPTTIQTDWAEASEFRTARVPGQRRRATTD